jgi:hypothetical protein
MKPKLSIPSRKNMTAEQTHEMDESKIAIDLFHRQLNNCLEPGDTLLLIKYANRLAELRRQFDEYHFLKRQY